MNDAQPSEAFTALLEQVEFVLTVTVPMTHQQEEVWPELRKRAKAARAAASSGASEAAEQSGERESLRSALQALVKIANALPGASLNGELLAACNIAYAAISAPASSGASEPEYGYTEAFYEISALLDIEAQDATPETVFKTQMLPKLRALIAERDRFANPPAEAVRQPLTADEIEDLWAGASIDQDDGINIHELARAIERAHGITGAQE